jgi:DNA-directed RNA polymerase subunit F
MVEIDIIEQKPLAMAELKDKLDNIKKTDPELNFRASKVYAYLSELSTIDKAKVEALYKKLSGLDLRLRDRHIVKIIDMMPKDAETLKVLFSGEALSLKQEELKQIVSIVND